MKVRAYIIEDSATIRANLIGTLEEIAGIEAVGMAETEEKGTGWLVHNDSQWDLAIVDLFLKEGSGLGVVKACRFRRPTQKMVVLSNHATPEIRWRCAQLGADAVFDKATEIDALLQYCCFSGSAIAPWRKAFWPNRATRSRSALSRRARRSAHIYCRAPCWSPAP